MFLSACTTTPLPHKPNSQQVISKTAVESTSQDPRLQKLTTQLLNSAKREKTGILKIPSEYHQTLQKLWPQHDLKFILSNPGIYKEAINDFPLMTQAQVTASLREKEVPEEILATMRVVNIVHRGFDGELHPGQLVVHQDAEKSTIEIFKVLEDRDFPITSVRLVNLYDWSDKLSVKMNNSSGFNWRLVGGSDEVSDHAFGSAIDINPWLNPWVKGGTVNDRYDVNRGGTITADSDIVKVFKKHGWAWGGDWKRSKDWQHFYRPEIPLNHFGKVEVPE